MGRKIRLSTMSQFSVILKKARNRAFFIDKDQSMKFKLIILLACALNAVGCAKCDLSEKNPSEWKNRFLNGQMSVCEGDSKTQN
jgi:hypothetical protein